MFTFKNTGAAFISSGVSTIWNDERPHFYRSLNAPITRLSTGFCPEPSCLYDLFRNWLFCSFSSICIVFIDCFECTTQEVARTYFSFYLQIRHFPWQKQQRGNFTTMVWCSSFCLCVLWPPTRWNFEGFDVHVRNLWIVCFHLAWPFVATEAKMSRVGWLSGAIGI